MCSGWMTITYSAFALCRFFADSIEHRKHLGHRGPPLRPKQWQAGTQEREVRVFGEISVNRPSVPRGYRAHSVHLRPWRSDGYLELAVSRVWPRQFASMESWEPTSGLANVAGCRSDAVLPA